MTVAVERGLRRHSSWAFVVASSGISVLLRVAVGPDAFDVGVTGMALLAATCMAVGDSRTGMLKNTWTAPFATAALLNILIAAVARPPALAVSSTSVIAVLLNISLYITMGLVGWIGFGDVKFMIGLALFAALLAGQASLLLAPVALLIAAGARATSRREPQSRRPHGPALALAFAVILASAWLASLGVVPPT